MAWAFLTRLNEQLVDNFFADFFFNDFNGEPA
jgi:hypothetical protein